MKRITISRSSVEESAVHSDWFKGLTKKQQADYLALHPHSKLAKALKQVKESKEAVKKALKSDETHEKPFKKRPGLPKGPKGYSGPSEYDDDPAETPKKKKITVTPKSKDKFRIPSKEEIQKMLKNRRMGAPGNRGPAKSEKDKPLKADLTKNTAPKRRSGPDFGMHDVEDTVKSAPKEVKSLYKQLTQIQRHMEKNDLSTGDSKKVDAQVNNIVKQLKKHGYTGNVTDGPEPHLEKHEEVQRAKRTGPPIGKSSKGGEVRNREEENKTKKKVVIKNKPKASGALLAQIKQLTSDIKEQKAYLADPSTKKTRHYKDEVDQLKEMQADLKKLQAKANK